MKDNHGNWRGGGYYRTGNIDDPSTIYWIESRDTRMWTLGSLEYPWQPVTVRYSPKRKEAP